MKLKIRSDHPVGGRAHVWLDDFEISRALTGLELDLSVSDVTSTVLSMHVTELDIDVDTLLTLKANGHIVTETTD